MKTRFTTIDLRATIAEIESRYLGMRVANVYDIDNKTYLIKLAKPDMKATLLLESGIRLHSTEFDWPKNITPSGFSMKMRKHLRTRRLEKVEQLGADRIVDLQFGSSEAAYHVILEMYDRGNMVLTDFEYTILNILRPRTDESQDVRFAVREKYPVDAARQPEGAPNEERLKTILTAGKEGDNLKKLLNPQLVYGPAVIDHCLLEAGFPVNARLGNEFNLENDLQRLVTALQQAETLLMAIGNTSKGYILQKAEKKPQASHETDVIYTNTEFHPVLYKQHVNEKYSECTSFCKAVDEFFSQLGTQKLDMKAIQQEKQALKKLENVKKDHEKRLNQLQQEQELDMYKASLIESNLQLVDRAIMIVKSALANQIDWTEINQIVKEAQAQGDPVAGAIRGLKLESNHITMVLSDPYEDSDDEEENKRKKPVKIDIDLALSAYANARKFYVQKKHAAKKETKTIESSGKALKSAEKKTKQTLKDVATAASINKIRKTYWFEKFLWFISSENFLIIGGRDGQQNEMIVKRYFRPGDLYVHADLHGASSVIIKNPSGDDVPPKTLNEAGTMAVCNSAAWDAKVYTSAWWVHHHQVSKTAPTGEYLSTGSFMIRGKKNFLPPCYLVYGFGFLFKVDDDSVFRHRGERRVRTLEEDASSVAESAMTESDVTENTNQDGTDDDEEESDNSDDDSSKGKLEDIEESDSEEAEKIPVGDGQKKESGTSEEMVKKLEKEDEAGNDADESDDDSDNDMQYPDTSIKLQHVKGEKFTLERNLSTVSQVSDCDLIELGDGVPLDLHPEKPAKAGAKISAKQRREMRKARQGKAPTEVHNENIAERDDKEIEVPGSEQQREEEHAQKKDSNQQLKQQQAQQQQQQQQPKRGQKKKMKKIKEKYADQDDEDREIRMQILASAGPQKEKKKDKKKDKKGRPKSAGAGPGTNQGQNQSQGQQNQGQKQGQGLPRGRLTLDDLKVETPVMDEKGAAASAEINPIKRENDEDAMSDEEKQALLEEENIRTAEDASIIDSLTGLPIPEEDGLLFGVPVCAPYTSLLNYKFKVKLMPGTTKRGKAVKTALNMFMHDKAASQREKELLRIVKDSDLSRNMSGKVKLSAPNLHKQKHK